MDSSDAVSVVALIVSVIALVGAILQLLQQYFSSAEGYKNCGQQVMGEWSLTRKRHFRFTELRFETQFEVPVIFLCPPDNIKGPLGARSEKTPLWHVDGTTESETLTRTPSASKEKSDKDRLKDSRKLNEDVHTADNERANWYILLQALHEMEKTSQMWQNEQLETERNTYGPKSRGELPETVAAFQKHTVVAALQPKRKSWDVMPGEIKKPYATTTICHIIEMAAMLGLHWREFDRSENRYHAEGNGYLLTGREVDDLGLMFSFKVYAKNDFRQRRIIPNEEIKRLAFGDVSTIYRLTAAEEKEKGTFDHEDPKSVEVLQFGSLSELGESLTHYGCNSKTVNYFKDSSKKHGHLFPVAFEVVGMVAKTVYIPDTYFRFLPNPTTFSWNRKNFSLRKLLLQYHEALRTSADIEKTEQICELVTLGKGLRTHLDRWENEDEFTMGLLSCLHRSIQACDRYLAPTNDKKQKSYMFKNVKLVIREHVQKVMRILNIGSATGTSTGSNGHDVDHGDDRTLGSKDRPQDKESAALDELNSAAPEARNAKLIEIYFRTVLPAVLKNCYESRTDESYIPSMQSRDNLSMALGRADDEADVASNRSETPVLDEMCDGLTTPYHDGEMDGGENEKKSRGGGVAGQQDEDKDFSNRHTRENEFADIWCTLLFRMLCWLLLHDFHKKDVQLSKSELYGSRLPVYIS
ncbi:hypothetical protein BD289DRAFT_361476 [Coniella lustricola]|uniref:Modin n=1 Tax=Coniella lustricola TaxID=2025994 RepID=A0A2T3AI97_9PEZI|nr:hypothetical protein BD289DRAFT_361476 [Coniella lustricola]